MTTSAANCGAAALRERYCVLRTLAITDLNIVSAGIDRASGAPVVIKAALAACHDPIEHRQRCYVLAYEALMLRRLERYGVAAPRLLDTFHHGGQPFLVMSRVAGSTLDTLYRAGRLPPTAAVAAIAAVAATLELLHLCGYVHHDVKPQNIVQPPAGAAVLIDWGSAAHIRPYGERSRFLAYTSGFASREQRLCQVLAANDIYALGRTLAALVAEPTPALAAIIRRASGAASQRYTSMRAFRSELAAYAGASLV